MVDDIYYMQLAIAEALNAQKIDEVPVGAVIVDQENRIIGRGFNKPISSVDPTSHAEINAIRNAARTLNNYRLIGTTLYVTIEPCVMCMGAIVHSRVKRVVYGAADLKWGAVRSLYQMPEDERFNHRVEITAGVMESETRKIIQDFFKHKRS